MTETEDNPLHTRFQDAHRSPMESEHPGVEIYRSPCLLASKLRKQQKWSYPFTGLVAPFF